MKTGPWRLTDLSSVPSRGKKVFSCFHCGGGSSMGYQLAGYEVVGGVEIDARIMELYRANFSPRLSYLMGVQDFNRLPFEEIPEELFELDLLDGSPPCSSFSTSGSREKTWGKKKKFREGQATQVLDELFFEFIKVADFLKPKVVVAENVKGLILGNAKGYVKLISAAFEKAGYDVQLFLLNAAFMGVPQTRERVFFIARRRDLKLPKLVLEFKEPLISVETALKGVLPAKPILDTKAAVPFWKRTDPGESLAKCHPTGSFFNWRRLHPKFPSPTVIADCRLMHYNEPRCLTGLEIARLQSFPEDYNFGGFRPEYVSGMSVPPLMMQRIADQIYRQWLSRDKIVVRKNSAKTESDQK